MVKIQHNSLENKVKETMYKSRKNSNDLADLVEDSHSGQTGQTMQTAFSILFSKKSHYGSVQTIVEVQGIEPRTVQHHDLLLYCG